ncbi:putative NAD-dependent protein deacetylase sirtuin-7-like 2, partial [Homarus americanus]
MAEEEGGAPAEPGRRKAAATASLNISKKNATRMKRVSSILRKKRDSLTLDDRHLLEENAELVEEFYK